MSLDRLRPAPARASLRAPLVALSVLALGAIGCSSSSDSDPTEPSLPGSLFGGTRRSESFAFLNPVSGATTRISEPGLRGLSQIGSLTRDPASDTLYGVDRLTDELVRVDPATGAVQSIGPIGVVGNFLTTTDIDGLTFDTVAGVLYGVESSRGILVTIDPASGLATDVGGLGASAEGLALDPATGTLYVSMAGELRTVDPSTGATTTIASFDVTDVEGLTFDGSGSLVAVVASGCGGGSGSGLRRVNTADATTVDLGCIEAADARSIVWDESRGAFFSVDLDSGELLRFDAMGTTQRVGQNGYPKVTGLSRDAAGGRLFAVTSGAGQLVDIDPLTGRGTTLHALSTSTYTSLSYEPVQDMLYAVDGATDELVRIDPTTGNEVRLGPLGFTDVLSLTFDPSGTLYGIFRGGSQLITLDTATGAGTFVVGYGERIDAVAFDGNGTLYGFGPSVEIVTIDLVSGALTTIGPVGALEIGSLTFDPDTGSLLGVDTRTGQLFAIDPATGADRSIGGVGRLSLTALAYDSTTGTTYGVDDDRLYRVDRATGETRFIGDLAAQFIESLAFVPSTGMLYGLSRAGSRPLVEIDPATATSSVIGNSTLGSPSGLAYDPGSDTLFAVTSSGGGLYTIDRQTGVGTRLGDLPDFGNEGLAFNEATNELIVTTTGGMLFVLDRTDGSEIRRTSIDEALTALAPAR
ncbi:MAG: hypothetical protein AAFP22_12960 [Planctomycetota bacterium]